MDSPRRTSTPPWWPTAATGPLAWSAPGSRRPPAGRGGRGRGWLARLPWLERHRFPGLGLGLARAGLLLHRAANVLQRLHRAPVGDDVEVVGRRRRGAEPLQRVGVPGVGARDRAAPQAAHDVD